MNYTLCVYDDVLRRDEPHGNAARRLPGEHHQGGVQNDREEEVASHQPAEREDGCEVGDTPLHGEAIDTSNDEADGTEAEDKRPLEPFDQLGYLVEEVNFFDFLRRRAPGHVDAEKVTQDCLGYVERQTTQEDTHDGDPFNVVPD